MKWYDQLYTGATIRDVDRVIRWIKRGARVPGIHGIYVITFASNPDNLLDIIPAWNLVQSSYPKEDLRIIGLAKGYDEALEVVRSIVQDTYDGTGTVNVRNYLKESQRSQL